MKFYNNTKKITLSLFLAFALCLIGTNNVGAKTYCDKTNKVNTCYVGKTKSNWTKRSKTYFSRKVYTTKYRTKDSYIKRTTRKKVTYNRTRTFYSGGRRVKSFTLTSNYGYVSGRWTYKTYNKVLYKSNGASYYQYKFAKRSNGKLYYKEIMSKGVRKKYNFDSTGKHVSTYQFKGGKWVWLWSAPKPVPPKPAVPTVPETPKDNTGKPLTTDQAGYTTGVVDKSKNMYIYVEAKSNSVADVDAAYAYAKSIHFWGTYKGAGCLGLDAWMPTRTSVVTNKLNGKRIVYMDYSTHEGQTQADVYKVHDHFGIKDHAFPVIVMK